VTAFQDQIPDNYCWGCGADNPDGLHLKSEWDGDDAIAHWTPWPRFAAGPKHILNGGIIATLLDCHGVCTASLKLGVSARVTRRRRPLGPAAPSSSSNAP
jgi:hypothetical protein